MSKAQGKFGVLCDTGFLIRLNQPQDPLHANARGYLKHLLAGDHRLYVSTIALAEYAVRDKDRESTHAVFPRASVQTSTMLKRQESSPGPSFRSAIRFLVKLPNV